MKERAKQTAIRFTEDERSLLAALSESMGVNQTSVIKIAIREKARAEGVAIKPPSTSATKEPDE